MPPVFGWEAFEPLLAAAKKDPQFPINRADPDQNRLVLPTKSQAIGPCRCWSS